MLICLEWQHSSRFSMLHALMQHAQQSLWRPDPPTTACDPEACDQNISATGKNKQTSPDCWDTSASRGLGFADLKLKPLQDNGYICITIKPPPADHRKHSTTIYRSLLYLKSTCSTIRKATFETQTLSDKATCLGQSWKHWEARHQGYKKATQDSSLPHPQFGWEGDDDTTWNTNSTHWVY